MADDVEGPVALATRCEPQPLPEGPLLYFPSGRLDLDHVDVYDAFIDIPNPLA